MKMDTSSYSETSSTTNSLQGVISQEIEFFTTITENLKFYIKPNYSHIGQSDSCL
jgi:hypothetical protein